MWATPNPNRSPYPTPYPSPSPSPSPRPEQVQQLNINQRSAESKRVMVRHPECEQAVLFIVPQVKVVPGPPAVRERLQANRAYISL